MSVLCSLVRAKRALGIPTTVTQHDDRLNDILGGMDAEVAQTINAPAITAAEYVDTFDIFEPSTRAVALRVTPVVTVGSVVDNGATVAAADYHLESANTGWVRLDSSTDSFTDGNQTVVVTYTAGYTSSTTDWSDLQTLAEELTVSAFNRGRHAGIESWKAGDGTTKVAADDLTPRARRIINRHKRPIGRITTGR